MEIMAGGLVVIAFFTIFTLCKMVGKSEKMLEHPERIKLRS